MFVEFMPHTEVNRDGSKSHSDIYPFVAGKPAPSLASCSMCTKYSDEESEQPNYICEGWRAEPDNAPLFCGPICDRFTPTPEAAQIILAILEEAEQ